MTGLGAAIDRLENWYARSALPLWACSGVDPGGGFYESLDFNGRPIIGQPRRVRVQCRQVYTFGEAARRGFLPEGEAIAARAFARLMATAVPDDGARGCAHLIDDSGAIIDATRDLYDQAFLLLACAARIRAGDGQARGIADRTLAFLDRELASPHGGFVEDDKRNLPRRQNPHMHLLEALMALFEATRDRSFLDRARVIEGLFESRFLDRDARVLREFFNGDWTLDPKNGDRLEPGHMMEWVYLLNRFEALTGENRAGGKQLLYRAAKAAIADPPFLPNDVQAGALTRRPRRLWPQTEALRAALVLDAAPEAAALIDALLGSYLNQPVAGLWMDEYDAEGRPLARDVPASILYHLHEAVSAAAEWRHRRSQ